MTSTRPAPRVPSGSLLPAPPSRCSHVANASQPSDYPPDSPHAPRRGQQQRQTQPEKRKPGQIRKRLIRPEGLFDKPNLSAARTPVPKPVIGSQDDTKRSKDKYTSDFIWNTNWEARWDFQQQERERRKQAKLAPPTKESGHLSLSRVTALNDMSVDMSAQLAAKPKPLVARNPAYELDLFSDGDKGSRFADRPSPHVSHKWDRSRSYVKRSAAMAAMTQQEFQLAGEQEARDAEQARFEQLRAEYGMWTSGAAAAGFAIVYSSFAKDAAASYLIGALGGIAYLRMLHRSVSSVGATSLGAAAGGMAAQPRLLIPVILTLFYNRYNLLYADSVGIHMELLPMLAGFFTYKAGVLGRATVALVQELRSGSDNAPVHTTSSAAPVPAPVVSSMVGHSDGSRAARASAQLADAAEGRAQREPVLVPRSPAAAANAVDALVDRQMRSAL